METLKMLDVQVNHLRICLCRATRPHYASRPDDSRSIYPSVCTVTSLGHSYNESSQTFPKAQTLQDSCTSPTPSRDSSIHTLICPSKSMRLLISKWLLASHLSLEDAPELLRGVCSMPVIESLPRSLRVRAQGSTLKCDWQLNAAQCFNPGS